MQTKNTSLFLPRVLAACGLAGLPARAQVPLYEMIDLGTLGGPSAVALDINARGHVVGEADDAQLTRNAYTWKQPTGLAAQITQLPGLVPGRAGSAWAINDIGQAVGHAYDSSFRFQATLWQNGQVAMLGTLGGPESFAFDINSSGVIVGASDVSVLGSPRAFVIEAFMQQLPGLGGSNSIAWSINDAGLVVGSSFLPAGGGEHGVLWQQGTLVEGWQVTDLLPAPGQNSAARAINERGDIAGWAQRDGMAAGGGPTRAIVWRAGDPGQPAEPIDLGTLPGMFTSRAVDLNASLEVVGYAAGLSGILDRAFYWSPGSGLHDLNNLIVDRGSRLMMSANAINDDGHIVGYGVDQGLARAFLLRPLG